MEDQLSGRLAPAKNYANDLAACADVFLQDKRNQGISEDALAKYTRELARLRAFCEGERVYVVQGLSRELLTRYCATWRALYPSTQTQAIVRARLRSFLRYAFEAQWIPRIPPLAKIKVSEAPTMPLTPSEFDSLLTATTVLKDPARQQRARCVFLLMRWTGLAVGDALKLRRDQLRQRDGLFTVITKRQKTGVDVSVPLPPAVAREILKAPHEWTSVANGRKTVVDPAYLFWDGSSDITNTWTRKLIPAMFKAAKIRKQGNMTSHRLRDTFATDLLQKGIPLEEVSKLLGHESIKTTERYYSAWVQGRQDRLNALVMATWKSSDVSENR